MGFISIRKSGTRRIDTDAGSRISKESRKHAHLDNDLFSADKSRPVTVTAVTGHFCLWIDKFHDSRFFGQQKTLFASASRVVQIGSIYPYLEPSAHHYISGIKFRHICKTKLDPTEMQFPRPAQARA